MELKKTLTEQNQRDIIELFKSSKNNSATEISRILDIKYFVVNNFLGHYLKDPKSYTEILSRSSPAIEKSSVVENEFLILESKMNKL